MPFMQTHLAAWLERSRDTRHVGAARKAWALQFARIHEVLPLLCPSGTWPG